MRISDNDVAAVLRALIRTHFNGRMPGASEAETKEWIAKVSFKLADEAEKEWQEKFVRLTSGLVERDCVISYRVNSHSIDFRIWELSMSNRPEKQKDFLGEGALKWDGCIDFKIGSEHSYVHLCGPEDTVFIKVLLDEVYKLGPKMETWE